MNRIRYRAVFGLASEKRRTDSRYAKKRPLRKKVSSHTKILPLKAVSVRYGQFLVAWANNALYQWLAGFLTFGSSQRRAFSLSQWHFAACSPVHSDEIVQVLHLFPFYPLPRESAKQRHQPPSYSVRTYSKRFRAIIENRFAACPSFGPHPGFPASDDYRGRFHTPRQEYSGRRAPFPWPGQRRCR